MMAAINKINRHLEGNLMGTEFPQMERGKLDKISGAGNIVQVGLKPRTDTEERTDSSAMSSDLQLCTVAYGLIYNNRETGRAFKGQIVSSDSKQSISCGFQSS